MALALLSPACYRHYERGQALANIVGMTNVHERLALSPGG